MAVSGLRFLLLTSPSHYKHIAFLVLGALRGLPIFLRVRKRREESRQ